MVEDTRQNDNNRRTNRANSRTFKCRKKAHDEHSRNINTNRSDYKWGILDNDTQATPNLKLPTLQLPKFRRDKLAQDDVNDFVERFKKQTKTC